MTAEVGADTAGAGSGVAGTTGAGLKGAVTIGTTGAAGAGTTGPGSAGARAIGAGSAGARAIGAGSTGDGDARAGIAGAGAIGVTTTGGFPIKKAGNRNDERGEFGGGAAGIAGGSVVAMLEATFTGSRGLASGSGEGAGAVGAGRFGVSVLSAADGAPSSIAARCGPSGSVFLKLNSWLSLRACALRSRAATALSDKRASSALKVWLHTPQRAMPPLALTWPSVSLKTVSHHGQRAARLMLPSDQSNIPSLLLCARA